MNIIVENKEAVLKKGTSFEYISENRFFTGADSYTLSITFPLKGCSENLAIFGHINRKDADFSKFLLSCEIHDRSFHAYGALSVVEINEREVKTQFLSGRSVQNFSSDLDDTFINEIPIGPMWVEACNNVNYHCAIPGSTNYTGHISLPWVNNSSGNMQNQVNYMRSEDIWFYQRTDPEVAPDLTCQYYLLYVLEKVLEHVNYSCDLSQLYNTAYKFLVIFNTFPRAWEVENYEMALPHWTIMEFLEQIEYFTHGTFVIDTHKRNVVFNFNRNININQKEIVLENVVDTHQIEITDPEDMDEKYIEQKNLKYQVADHQMQKFYNCDWFLNTYGYVFYLTYADLKADVQNNLSLVGVIPNRNPYKRLLYAADIYTTFVLQCYRINHNSDPKKTTHFFRLLPVNQFCPRYDEKYYENTKVEEMGIVPVCIDHTSDTYGDCVFLECGSYGDVEDFDSNQSFAVNMLAEGEKEQKKEYFDKLYVGYWDGRGPTERSSFLPIPWIDNIYMDHLSNIHMNAPTPQMDFSMRLRNNRNKNSRLTHEVGERIKYTFKFISTNGIIPDVQSVFIIHGKRYLAEKITATFSENGMSQLLKMVAYRIR